MTPKQFRAFKRNGYKPVILVPRYVVTDDDPQLVQGQAFSVQKLMEMQAQGLPMPNLQDSKMQFAPCGFDEFAERPSAFADLAEISDLERASRQNLDLSLREDSLRLKRKQVREKLNSKQTKEDEK